mgnify:CR=1 FL=1
MLTDLHTCNWLSTEHLPGVLVPKCGVMAGTSPADLLYCIMLAQVLRTTRSQLEDKQLVETLKPSDEEVFECVKQHLRSFPFKDKPNIGFIVATFSSFRKKSKT